MNLDNPTTPMNSTHDTRPSLLPGILKRPLMLLWLWVVPQAALLLLNLRAWSLASGEASVDQARAAAGLGAAGLGLFAAGLAAWIVPRLLKRTVSLPLCLVGLLLNIGYLWLFVARFDHAWPRAVAEWMLPQTEIMFYQFALVMPALFYCALRLACVDLPVRRGADIGISFGMFVAVPLAWYAIFHIVELLAHRFFRGSMEIVAIVFFAGSTVLVMMAFLRLLYYLYRWLSDQFWGVTAMTAVSGLLLPVSGLLLNIKIPFPCDFQSVGVYVLAVLNGAVLIVPLPRHAGLAALTWWARSALYLFTLYFFVVFLPFLPLSLLAMIACGAGFLILAPTLLFIIHTRRLVADASALAARLGRVPVLALFLLGTVTLPAGFAARAWMDRQALTAAMNAVFSPDLRESRVAISTRTVSHSLDSLRDMKDGIYLPFLSDAYNRIAFNGMVLPDDKMDTLSRVLLGRPAAQPNKSDRFSFFLAPRARSRWGGGANRPLPPRNVTLRPPALDGLTTSNGITRATVKLEMLNPGAGGSEFVGTLTLPDGVLVSGFWLDVAGKRKPGLIVEKKTALWVYHMIRDFTRRDPGLLIYKGEGLLELSVFPFAPNETRTVWLEFLGPSSLQSRIAINAMPLPSATDPAPALATPCLVAGADACLVPGAALAQFPQAAREPIVRFILDRSVVAATNAPVIPPALCEAAAQLGGRCRVTFANVESLDADLAPLSPADAAELARLPTELPARGGFAPDRVIARHLLASSASGATVPIFVVIPAPGSTPVRTLDLAPFASLAPDAAAYYLWSTDHLERVTFADGSRNTADTLSPPRPVVLFRAAGRTAAALPDAAGAVFDMRGSTGPATLDVYNPESNAFEAVPSLATIAHPDYAAGLRLLLDCRAVQQNPAALDPALPEFLARSKASRILCPYTSYMVVENTAQEKTLEQRQAQALGGHHALEFEESVKSPEPGLLCLLPVALVIVWWRLRPRRV